MASRVASVKVTGMKPLLKALKKLPENSRNRVLKPATSKATTPVVKAAKKFIPLGEGLKPDGSPREHLRKTISKTRPKVYKNGSVVVTTGPKFRAAPHSHLVDKGTKAHQITLTKPWGLVPAGTVLQHPGAQAAHFMDKALDAVGDKVQSTMEKGIAKGIEKEAAKLAAKK
jgi:HK97 gp10 family phage protein